MLKKDELIFGIVSLIISSVSLIILLNIML